MKLHVFPFAPNGAKTRLYLAEKRAAGAEIEYEEVKYDPPKVILLTSAHAGEGKTTLASNLAISFAQRGRTLLLEADLDAIPVLDDASVANFEADAAIRVVEPLDLGALGRVHDPDGREKVDIAQRQGPLIGVERQLHVRVR